MKTSGILFDLGSPDAPDVSFRPVVPYNPDIDPVEHNTVAIRSGKGSHEGNPVTDVRSQLADLDADGFREVLVHFTVTGQNLPLTKIGVALFENDATCKLKYVGSEAFFVGATPTILGGAFSVEGRELVGTWTEVASEDGRQQKEVRTEWKLVGGRLKQVSRKETPKRSTGPGVGEPDAPQNAEAPKAKGRQQEKQSAAEKAKRAKQSASAKKKTTGGDSKNQPDSPRSQPTRTKSRK